MRQLAHTRYKATGIEWIEEIPEGWSITRVKHLLKSGPDGLKIGPFGSAIKLEMMVDSAEGFPIFGQENVISDDFSLGKRFLPRNLWPEFSVYRIEPGDLLVTMMGTTGRWAVVPDDAESGIIDSHLMRLRTSTRVDKLFLRRALAESVYTQSQIAQNSKGSIMQGLNGTIVGNLRVIVPPLDGQRMIASFLDTETAKIDTLVREYEDLVALLTEKRQALISHAVTRGLSELVEAQDPEFCEWARPVRFVDSGVEWLGEIPEGWTATRLKFCCTRILDCPHETPEYSLDGEFLVVRTADIADGVLLEDNMYRVSHDTYLDRIRRSSLENGDIVYSREGERWGHAALVPESGKFCLGQRMMQMKPSAHWSPHFQMWALISDRVYQQGAIETVGATAPHVNVETVANYRITEPPLVEQIAIASFLTRETTKIDTLVRETQDAIELLKEHRSALITAAVTGKINVEALA